MSPPDLVQRKVEVVATQGRATAAAKLATATACLGKASWEDAPRKFLTSQLLVAILKGIIAGEANHEVY